MDREYAIAFQSKVKNLYEKLNGMILSSLGGEFNIVKRGGKWCLIRNDGTKIGCHSTKKGALKQAAAVNISRG